MVLALVAAGTLTHTQGRAAAMWSGDLDVQAQAKERAARTGPSRTRQPRQHGEGVSLEGNAVRLRLRAFESRAGGEGTHWHRAAKLVFHRGMDVDEAAETMDMEQAQVRTALRVSAQGLAEVYGLVEVLPARLPAV